ncbi:unconventional myosin-X-like [Protopterus annectens]|uniref:unconventional myosin-X-like n=1 Tax=Protopterus annectens TaxID=7888 RepID=UPI001CFB431E|nr:unconventional myosin-X-like [Protopterus annectens]
MDNYFTEGTRVWLKENGQHFPSTVSSCAEGVIVFTTDYGQVFTYKQNTITRQKVSIMHSTSIETVEDMATLTDLHEGSILYNLYQRYKLDKIYTYIGSILASVNPYKIIHELYDHSCIELYSKHHLGEIAPHIFSVANECYRCLWKRHDNQCVLISGESGAGKTESTKLILKFLSAMSQHSLEVSAKEKSSHVERAILESSPIMEAFGNAKTIYNSNSSRFGKFIQLNFCQKGNIQGGKIVDCILLYSRTRALNDLRCIVCSCYYPSSNVVRVTHDGYCMKRESGSCVTHKVMSFLSAPRRADSKEHCFGCPNYATVTIMAAEARK